MDNVEKTSNCSFKSGKLSLLYFEYVKTLVESLSSLIIKNQQIAPAKYTVLMLRLCQNGRKKAFGRSAIPRVIPAAKMFGCSRVIAHSLVRRFEQTGISIEAQDRRDQRKQCQDKTLNLHSPFDVSTSSRQL